MNATFEIRLLGTDIPHIYRAIIPNPDGSVAAENSFELRSDSVELTLTLGALARAAASGEKPEKELHVEFGQRIFKLLFSGKVGEVWRERRKQAGRKAPGPGIAHRPPKSPLPAAHPVGNPA